ncbi:MAG: glutamate racemase [bacterium]
MDTRPIGVFDSGLGGLTAVKKLSQVLPGEDIVYFGDTGRVPYGSRSRETILRYAREDIAFLRRFAPKCILAACGTVSTNGLEELAAVSPVPLFGVVEPAARAAAAATKTGRIGLIGTSASVRSGAYERKISALLPGAVTTARACPLLVPLVENGKTGRDDPVLRLVAEEYLAPLRAAGVDTLILGCTHYPLIAPAIGDIMGAGVTLVDTGAEAAKAIAALLREREMLADRREGTHRYYVTDSTEGFAASATLFLGEDVRGEVTRVSLS